jgi:hypothetical protein
MGAPLRSRSSFTCAAEMFVVVSVLIFKFPSLKTSFYNILTRVALRLTRAINPSKILTLDGTVRALDHARVSHVACAPIRTHSSIQRCGAADLRAEPPASGARGIFG